MGLRIKRVDPERGACALELTEYPGDYHLPGFAAIEARVTLTQSRGRLPLWHGYAEVDGYPRGAGAGRSVAQVRAKPEICRFYSWLVTRKRPQAVLEFGAAFGVSGMYWLAGLEATATGRLYSFEPNPLWHAEAAANFAAVSPRAVLSNTTFEAGAAALPGIDIALIDAIHTGDFVRAQFARVRGIARPGALILFDDIDFSADMRRVWSELREAECRDAAWEVNGRLGIIALKA